MKVGNTFWQENMLDGWKNELDQGITQALDRDFECLIY